MIFKNTVKMPEILRLLEKQISPLLSNSKIGLEVIIRDIKPKRTVYQNRFLMVVLNNIVQFYVDTGFIPKGLSSWAMRADILKEYFKARLGVLETSKLSKQEFIQFVDNIQFEMVIESNGEYQIITIDDINYNPEKYERML